MNWWSTVKRSGRAIAGTHTREDASRIACPIVCGLRSVCVRACHRLSTPANLTSHHSPFCQRGARTRAPRREQAHDERALRPTGSIIVSWYYRALSFLPAFFPRYLRFFVVSALRRPGLGSPVAGRYSRKGLGGTLAGMGPESDNSSERKICSALGFYLCCLLGRMRG